MSDAITVLKQRGFVQQCSDEDSLRRAMDTGPVTYYVGFDPTGSSLHVGNLVSLLAMAHLQKAGHRAVALIGGGTARIGDPSGKTETRKMLSVDTIKANGERFKTQIARFLDFSRAKMVDNADWLAGLNYIEFLRDIGRHFSVNRMLSFETYKMRLETGLSFIEFNYQLLQSYDFLELYRKHGCVLQMGGDDQWGNIVSGIDLIRRVESAEVYALTTPLITTSDGKKMGKTEKGALWLDPDLVSPYEFYQYWINVADADVKRFLLLYTFLPVERIAELAKAEGQDLRAAKETLAFEVTAIVHGEAEAQKARETSRSVFGGGNKLDVEAMPSVTLSASDVVGMPVVDLFANTDLCKSKGEARRLVTQGGAYMQDVSVNSIDAVVGADAIVDGSIILRAGKKRYFRVVLD